MPVSVSTQKYVKEWLWTEITFVSYSTHKNMDTWEQLVSISVQHFGEKTLISSKEGGVDVTFLCILWKWHYVCNLHWIRLNKTETFENGLEFFNKLFPWKQIVLFQHVFERTHSVINICIFFFQEQVDDGIPLHLCIRKFARWLESLKGSKGVVFTQTAENCNLATIVTWSGNYLSYLFIIYIL